MKPLARRILRYFGLGLTALLLVVLVGAGYVFVAGGRALEASYDGVGHDLTVPTDSVAIAEGGRLARLWGCLGCHDRDGGGGEVFVETPLGDRVVAPNLTRVAREYSVAELEGAIRHGVAPDGRGLVVMPSPMFARASDEDVAKVIAHLRALEPVPDTVPQTRFGLLARFLAVQDAVSTAAEDIDHDAPHGTSPDSLSPASAPTDTLTLGRYIARTSCTECHGPDLRGDDGDTPDLRIAAAYSADQFRRLARKGIALDGTERELMTTIARTRMSFLTDDEIAALHTYLKTLAD